jgi:hypothetical protein
MRRYRADLRNSQGRSMAVVEVSAASASAAARQADRILAGWPGYRTVMRCLDAEEGPFAAPGDTRWGSSAAAA